MGCRFNKHQFAILALIIGFLVGASGCISYQYERRVEGVEIKDPGDAFPLGETSIGDILSRLGAPDEVYSLDNTDLLVYRRSLLQESGISLGFPMLDVVSGGSIDFSTRGALKRYDTLTFWFNSQGILEEMVFEKASARPYLKTLFSK